MRDISVWRDLGKWWVDLPPPYNYQGSYCSCCKHSAICDCIKEYQADQKLKEEGF